MNEKNQCFKGWETLVYKFVNRLNLTDWNNYFGCYYDANIGAFEDIN